MKNVNGRFVMVIICFMVIAQFLNGQALNQGFIAPSVYRQGFTKIIRKASEGKLYVYGDFNFHGDRQIGDLVRIHPDGLLDNSFTTYFLPAGSQILDLEVLSSGNVVIIKQNEFSATVLEVLNPDGNVIKTLNPGDASYRAVEPDGEGGFFLARYGNVDQYSGAYNYVKRIASAVGPGNDVSDIQFDGSHVVIAGRFTSVRDGLDGSNQTRHFIARYELSGHLDRSFNANTALAGLQNVQGVFIQPDGKIVPLDHHTPNSGKSKPIRLNANGSPDTGFTYPFPSNLAIEDAHYENGKLTIVTNRKIARLNGDGSLDPSFAVINYNQSHVIATVLSDGAVIAGNYQPATYGFAKFSGAGIRIDAFYGRLMRHGEIYSMDRTSTSIFLGGDFVKVGNHFTRNVVRLNLDGTILAKFKSGILDPVVSVDALPNAKVLASTRTKVHRLVHDGTMDPGFSYTSVTEIPYILRTAALPDQKIIVAGPFELIRLNSNGSRDTSFDADLGTPVGPNTVEFDIEENTGKILYTNWQYEEETSASPTTLLRLNPDGSRDGSFEPPSFDPDSFSAFEKGLFLDNGQMLVLKPGYLNSDDRYDLIKLNSDGSLVEEFADNADGNHSSGIKMLLFGNRILLVRHTATSSEDPQSMSALLLDGTPDPSFAMPLEVDRYTILFSDNDTELFVINNKGLKPLTKLTYTPVTGTSLPFATALRFYPNPVTDKVTIDVANPGTVNIFDYMGTRTLSFPVVKERNTIELNQLTPGRYIIEVVSERGRYREQFMKE